MDLRLLHLGSTMGRLDETGHLSKVQIGVGDDDGKP